MKKLNFVIFRPRQKSLPFFSHISVLDYEMNSHKPLEMKEYVKYLGVYIDADLFWNTISSTYSEKLVLQQS